MGLKSIPLKIVFAVSTPHFSALLAGILLPFLALPALLGPRPDGLIRAGTRDRFGPRGFVLTWGSMLADIPGFSPGCAVSAHPVAVSTRDWRLAQYSRLISRSG